MFVVLFVGEIITPVPREADFLIDASRLLERITTQQQQHPDLMRLSTYGSVKTPEKRFPLVRLDSSFSSDTWMIVVAGFHGDEIGGPLTLLHYVVDFFVEARQKGVHLVVYPCVNPSGFDKRTRYNYWGERANSDFMRYVRGDEYIDDLGTSMTSLPWRWNQDLGIVVPNETMQLREDLRTLPFGNIKALLDVHQDCFQKGRCTYAYVFGDRRAYRRIMREAEKYARLCAHQRIDEGYGSVDTHPTTDAHGLLTRHDCSLEDLFYRLGVPHVVAVETTTDLPLGNVYAINRLWFRELLACITKG